MVTQFHRLTCNFRYKQNGNHFALIILDHHCADVITANMETAYLEYERLLQNYVAYVIHVKPET